MSAQMILSCLRRTSIKYVTEILTMEKMVAEAR